MRNVTTYIQDGWTAAYKGGSESSGMVRATIQRVHAVATPYETTGGTARMMSVVFGQYDVPVELPNIASVKWDRSVDNDAATMTMTLWNTEILPIGSIPTPDTDTLDITGFFSPNRGDAGSSDQWGLTENGWRDLIAPDNVIRTFEGYGFDDTEIPELDPHLAPSGVWMIDDVELDEGIITVTARDFGRLLLDAIAIPPIIPFDAYPMMWAPSDKSPLVPIQDTTSTPTPGAEVTTVVHHPAITTLTGIAKPNSKDWFVPNYRTDSNKPYVGVGFRDGPRAYVDSDGGILGHRGIHAFDKSKKTFWLSVGNESGWSSAYEYVEGRFSSRSICAVSVDAWSGPYTVFVSVFADGAWQGKTVVPYKHRVIDAGTRIPYVMKAKVARNGTLTVKLPKAYANATKIRITFTNLVDTGIGRYQYRAGCRGVRVLKGTNADHVVTTDTVTSSRAVQWDGDVEHVIAEGLRVTSGIYTDFTDILKWLCVWAGLYWPEGVDAYQTLSDGTTVTLTPPSRDPVLPTGRVWGDFEDTGTRAQVAFDATNFDKQPFTTCVSQIRDMIGNVFFIDESGGAVWRAPNIWSVGNWRGGVRTTDVTVIDEKVTLLGLKVKLSSRNVRDRIFVANIAGGIGAVSAGYNPNPTNLLRIGGYCDENFESVAEAQQMADLITIRQAFEYRMNTFSIPGHPGIQVDDQVRVFEKTTAESALHYVSGISMTWDRLSGAYKYGLSTHWLGEGGPGITWAFDPLELAAETQYYLRALGRI